MKHFSKKKMITLGIIISFLITLIAPNYTFAAEGDNCSSTFFGLNPWNCNVVEEVTSEDQLKSNIVAIASNVLTDLTIIASYLVIGYVIYGGYLYMFSDGEPGKAANGKKTLLHAFIGLAIVMSASIILGAIRIALIGNSSLADAPRNVNTGEMVTNLIHWVIGVSGIVAAVFLVIGGISYLTSSGDSTKLAKAKSTIIYAIIGLVIVAFAEVATAFVSGLIRNAQKSDNQTSLIIIENPNRKEIQ